RAPPEPAVKGAAAPPKASVEKAASAKKPPDGEGSGSDDDGKGDEGASDVVSDPMAPASAALLGRGQEVSFAISVGQWSQRYLSDAQNDPYCQYALSSTGPAGTLSYASRGDFPVVADVRLSGGVFGFDLVAPGASEPSYTSVFTAELAAHVGWRLHGDEIVDVEAGVGSRASVIWAG